MSKKIIPKLLVALSFVIAAVLFLMSELEPDQFGWFNLSWAGVIFAGVSGLALLFGALGQKTTSLKKLQLLLSGILLVVVSVFLVLGILFTGGKKWDTGDNQKIGYKNYYQRKAEEERHKDKEDE